MHRECGTLAELGVKTEDGTQRAIGNFTRRTRLFPSTATRLEAAELDKYPKGYCFLGAAQARLGYEIDVHLPTPGHCGIACME